MWSVWEMWAKDNLMTTIILLSGGDTSISMENNNKPLIQSTKGDLIKLEFIILSIRRTIMYVVRSER